MTERRDDTTKPGGESRPAKGGGRYYYDDATGYETYRPEDEADGEEAEEEEAPGACGTDAPAPER